jgi:hypothetical protein
MLLPFVASRGQEILNILTILQICLSEELLRTSIYFVEDILLSLLVSGVPRANSSSLLWRALTNQRLGGGVFLMFTEEHPFKWTAIQLKPKLRNVWLTTRFWGWGGGGGKTGSLFLARRPPWTSETPLNQIPLLPHSTPTKSTQIRQSSLKSQTLLSWCKPRSIPNSWVM